MKRIVLAAIIALSLGGCAKQVQEAKTIYATLTGSIVTPTQVIVAANAFDAVKVTATNYLRLPPCPRATVCRAPAATQPIITAIRAGTADRDRLKATLRANPGTNLTIIDVYQDLRDSTAALETLIIRYNMRGA